MKQISLENLNLLNFGNEIGMWGVVYEGLDHLLLLPFPDAEADAADRSSACVLRLNPEEWEKLLKQVDLLNVELPTKAIVRKSQRRIDSNISWAVFRRDGYRCRYCGEEKPLTVDHVDLWEDGGVTVPANLISSCGPCNKSRGRMPYGTWLSSKEYKRRSEKLDSREQSKNVQVLDLLPHLQTLRVDVQRSR